MGCEHLLPISHTNVTREFLIRPVKNLRINLRIRLGKGDLVAKGREIDVKALFHLRWKQLCQVASSIIP